MTPEQDAEIREMARRILESRCWGELPWPDAWNGAYPLRPSEQEIITESEALKAKVLRIMSGGSLEYEYRCNAEHIRMIYLEAAKTFNVHLLARSDCSDRFDE